MSKAYRILLALVVLLAVTFIVQLWFEPFEGHVFFKIMVTQGILLAVAGAYIAIRHDTEDDDKLKKDKFIN